MSAKQHLLYLRHTIDFLHGVYAEGLRCNRMFLMKILLVLVINLLISSPYTFAVMQPDKSGGPKPRITRQKSALENLIHSCRVRLSSHVYQIQEHVVFQGRKLTDNEALELEKLIVSHRPDMSQGSERVQLLEKINDLFNNKDVVGTPQDYGDALRWLALLLLE